MVRNSLIILISSIMIYFGYVVINARQTPQSQLNSTIETKTTTRSVNDSAPSQTGSQKPAIKPQSAIFPSDKGNDSPTKAVNDKQPSSTVTDYLSTQNYSSMTPKETSELLKLLTLGEGEEFERSRKNHIVSLAAFERENPKRKSILSQLHGLYRSEFVDSTPNEDGADYSIELQFNDERFTASIVRNSEVYYRHSFIDLKNQLLTGRSADLPPNLFVELPAKKELGYLHPMYLEIMIDNDMHTLIAVMYNTNQFVNTANYMHAEHLIFNKVAD